MLHPMPTLLFPRNKSKAREDKCVSELERRKRWRHQDMSVCANSEVIEKLLAKVGR